jgi:Ca2+-binding RTX toxin-like protein
MRNIAPSSPSLAPSGPASDADPDDTLFTQVVSGLTTEGSRGGDRITGDNGDDRLSGRGGHDIIRGQAGNDILNGNAGNDTLHGDDGHDRLEGDAGSDSLFGGAGNDILYGGGDDDSLLGGYGSDELYGGPGDDFINGEFGSDHLYGGRGNDTLFDSVDLDEGETFYADGGEPFVPPELSGNEDNDTLSVSVISSSDSSFVVLYDQYRETYDLRRADANGRHYGSSIGNLKNIEELIVNGQDIPLNRP